MVSADWKSRPVAFDCRYFLGDRPCVWHKREGALCICDRYERVEKRILIIKLDAIGDVLRTTCVLPPLAKAHPTAAIDWLTRPEALPLLENNPYLSDAIALGPEALVLLSALHYDEVINLDPGKTSAALAKLASGARKTGFVLDARGLVTATNPAAEMWLKMGLFDDLKRSNTRSYPDIMCEILGVPSEAMGYVLELEEAEIASARARLEELGITFDRPVIGLNTGAGDRWALKKWREDGFVDLIDRLHEDHGAGVQVMLLGGRDELERNDRIAARSKGPVFNSGFDPDIRRFAALVSLCDVTVCGDTLALHLAIASGGRVVALFGPTSAAEIELFGTGRKIAPEMDCLGCYKAQCDFVPNCMDLITSELVADAVSAELSIALGRG